MPQPPQPGRSRSPCRTFRSRRRNRRRLKSTRISTTPLSAGYGLEAESLPGELTEDISGASGALRLGPTPVSEVRFLMDTLGIANLVGDSGIRTFGWVEGGYTGASTGAGMLSVQPRQNRFGDEFLLNQIGWAIQKPLKQDQFDWGFNMRYFAGSDAALGAAKGGIGWPAGQSAFRSGLPRPLPVGPFADPHRRRRGPQGRPHEHDHRLQRLPGPVPAVLLQRLPVFLFAGRCLHRLPDQPARQQSTGHLERDDPGCQHVLHPA